MWVGVGGWVGGWGRVGGCGWVGGWVWVVWVGAGVGGCGCVWVWVGAGGCGCVGGLVWVGWMWVGAAPRPSMNAPLQSGRAAASAAPRRLLGWRQGHALQNVPLALSPPEVQVSRPTPGSAQMPRFVPEQGQNCGLAGPGSQDTAP